MITEFKVDAVLESKLKESNEKARQELHDFFTSMVEEQEQYREERKRALDNPSDLD